MIEICIDCGPGSNGRQGTYLLNILSKLKQHTQPEIRDWAEAINDTTPGSTSFGEWSWEFSSLPNHTKEVVNFFIEELTAIYNDNGLRFASCHEI